MPRIAIQAGTPDPGGLLKDLLDRAGPSRERGPAETAAVNVAGPQPLDAADAASADGAPIGNHQRMAKADPLPVAKRSGPTSDAVERTRDIRPSIGPPLAGSPI